MTKPIQKTVLTGVYFLIAALCVRGFFEVGKLFSDFRIVYGLGVESIHPAELVYFLWFLLFGIILTVALSFGFYRTQFPEKITHLFDGVVGRHRQVLIGTTALVFGMVALFRVFVLVDSPVADDESTYIFIAKTLLHGRLTNPLPHDASFFQNQFVVLNSHGWFGKYPIGHPVLLALGEILGTQYVVGPLVTCFSLILTYLIGSKAFGRKVALLGVLLLAASPHFIFTGATLLSQTTSTLSMLSGLLFTLYFLDSKRAVFGAAAGFCWAFCILTRPLPGVIFPVAVVLTIFASSEGKGFFNRINFYKRYWIPVVLFCAAVGAVLLFINLELTGSLLKSGYHAVHGANVGIGIDQPGLVTMSVAGAFLRQNFWLFGWPVSLVFVWFMKRNSRSTLFIALIVAEYLYRVIAPKTVVSTTGPIYVTEIVPLLALASASGVAELTHFLKVKGFATAKSAVAAFILASFTVALVCFWSVQIHNIRAGNVAWRMPITSLEAKGEHNVLIFANHLVDPQSGLNWAYFPPNPSPSLDDDYLFVRIPMSAGNPRAEMQAFHQRRFPSRSAFIYYFVDGRPTLEPLPAP